MMRMVSKLLTILVLLFTVAELGFTPNASAENIPLFSKGWDKTFGGAHDEYGSSVQLTSDGGYISTGSTQSYGAGQSDVYLLKTDGNGNKQWERTFGGAGPDDGSSVLQTSDGGYIIVGSKALSTGYFHIPTKVYVIKTDAQGNEQWENTYGGDYSATGRSVQQTSDGGYVITGSIWSDCTGGISSSDVYLIRITASGDLLWEKTFGGDSANEIQKVGNSGYIIVGTATYGISCPFIGGLCGIETKVYVVRTDLDGKMLWSQTYGESKSESGYSIKPTIDGGYIIVGEEYSSNSNNILLIKTNASGVKAWEKSFSGYGNSVQQTSEGGYMIAGSIDNRGYLLKTDGYGNKLWDTAYEGAHFNSVKQIGNNAYIVIGAKNMGSSTDLYLVKYIRWPLFKSIYTPLR